MNSVLFGCSLFGRYDGNHSVVETLCYPLKRAWVIKAPKGGFSHFVGDENGIYALIGAKKGIVGIDVSSGDYLWQHLGEYKHEGGGLWMVGPNRLFVMESNRRSEPFGQILDAGTGSRVDEWVGYYEPHGYLGDGFVFRRENALLVNPDDLSVRQKFTWGEQIAGTPIIFPGREYWVGQVKPESVPGAKLHAGAFDPKTGKVKYIMENHDIPLCANGGYWVARAENSPADRSGAFPKSTCIIEERSGKVLWEIGMIPKTLKKGPAYPIPVTHAVIHTCRDCIVMAMRCATDDGDATIECFDLASGKRRWKVVVGHPTFEMPVSWLLATGDVVWTTEEVATATGNPHNVKKHKALVARDIHTGETLWKKRESSGAAIIAGGKLILNGHNSMKCYTSA